MPTGIHTGEACTAVSRPIWTIDLANVQISREHTQEMKIAMSKVSKVCVEPEI